MSIQRYIDQLISDLRAARLSEPPKMTAPEDDIVAFMDEIENAPIKPPKTTFGVSYEELPPAERLSPEQMQQVVTEMVLTIESFGMSVDFQPGLPMALKYKLLRETFKDELHCTPGWHLDFCTGHCPCCLQLDYCQSGQELWTPSELKKYRDENPNDPC